MKLRFPISKLDYLLTQSEWIGTFIRNGWIWIWAQSWSASAKSVTIEFSHLSSLSRQIEECVLAAVLFRAISQILSKPDDQSSPAVLLCLLIICQVPLSLFSLPGSGSGDWWLGLVTTAMINVSKNQTLSPVIAHHRTCQSCLDSS